MHIRYLVILDPYPLYVNFLRLDTVFVTLAWLTDNPWPPVSYAIYLLGAYSWLQFSNILRSMREILQASAWTPCSQCHPNLNGLLTQPKTLPPLQIGRFTGPLPLPLYPWRNLSQWPLWFRTQPIPPQCLRFPKPQDWFTGLTQLPGSRYHHPSPFNCYPEVFTPQCNEETGPSNSTSALLSHRSRKWPSASP